MKEWYLKLPNAVRAAINSTWQSFVAVFGITLLGFLAKVQDWAGCDGPTCHFPAVSPLGKALAGALVAAVTGFVTLIFRTLKPGPVYPTTTTQVVPPEEDKGYGLLVTILIVLGIILVALLILTHVDINTH